MKRCQKVLTRIRQLLHREDGGALAELAILVPFLAVMLAGVCEFGRYFQNYNTAAKGTRAAARYLSNHKLTAAEIDRAQSLVVCGKLACTGSDRPLLTNLTKANVCVESTGTPKVTSVTVRLPTPDLACNPTTNAPGASPYTYRPIFNIGALLGTSLSMALPIAPSVTMYYMID